MIADDRTPSRLPAGQARLRARHILLLAGVGAGLLAAAVWANLWKEDLPVRDVVVRGNSIVSAKEIVVLAAVPRTQKLFEVDLFAVRARLAKNAFLKRASVNRDAPDRITIEVEERVPAAAVAVDRLMYLDAEGVVLPHVRSEHIFDLPVLTGAVGGSTMVPGRRIEAPEIRSALGLLDAARRYDETLYHAISEVHIADDGEMTLFTSDGGVRVLFGRGGTVAKLAKFDAFWHTYVTGRGAAALEAVDLRFEDQVVVRWRRPLAEPFSS